MTEPTKHQEDAMLDALFEAGQDAGPTPSEALMARIVADATQMQPEISAETVPPKSEPSVLARLRDALGGWTGVGGLATATMAGLFFGFSQPNLVGLTSQAGFETAIDAEFGEGEDWADAEVWPGDDLFFEEG